MDESIRLKLVHLATEYDRKRQGKRDYNRYALGHYFQAIERVAERVDSGQPLRAAIVRSFTGRLCDRLLVGLQLQPLSKSEARSGIPA